MKGKLNPIVLGFALLAGLFGGLGMWKIMESYKQEVPILVATRDIRVGQQLGPGDVQVRLVHPSGALSDGYNYMQELFHDQSGLVIARSDIYANQQILRSAVQTNGTSNTLSFLLTEMGNKNARAITFQGTTMLSFGGRIRRNDKVDIIATFRQQSIVPEAATKRVLSGVHVLDVIGTQLQDGRWDIDTITVMVDSPAEAELLAMTQVFADRITFSLVPIGGGESLMPSGLTRQTYLDALGLQPQVIIPNSDISSLLGGGF